MMVTQYNTHIRIHRDAPRRFYLLYIIVNIITAFPPPIFELASLVFFSRAVLVILNSVCLIMSVAILYKQKTLFNIKYLPFIALIVSLTIAIILANKYYFVGLLQVFRLITLLMFVICIQHDAKSLLMATGILTKYFYILLIANLLTMLTFREGIIQSGLRNWQGYWLIGNPNSFAFFFIYSTFIILIHSYIKHGKIMLRCFMYIIIEIITAIVVSISSTAIILSIMLGLLALFLKYSKAFGNVKIYNIISVIHAVITIAIVFGAWNTEIVQKIIMNLTGESVTLLARGLIWRSALNNITQHLWFGSGFDTYDFSNIYTTIALTAHNSFLQVTLIGGVISLVLYVAVMYRSLYDYNQMPSITTYISCTFTALTIVLYTFEQSPFNLGILFVFLLDTRHTTTEKRDIHSLRILYA